MDMRKNIHLAEEQETKEMQALYLSFTTQLLSLDVTIFQPAPYDLPFTLVRDRCRISH